MDNGDQVILGHMSQITVPVGTRVGPGMAVGKSGSDNGAHVHVEYRRKTPGATSSGYTIIDPRTALGGNFTGGYSGGGGYAGQQAAQPMSLNQVMLALLQGQSVPGYSF
jgi:murein DD-endopeptidase MepM/ murein hydrolase activator NlpD